MTKPRYNRCIRCGSTMLTFRKGMCTFCQFDVFRPEVSDIRDKSLPWYEQAKCKGMDVDSFFPDDRGEMIRPWVRAVCSNCPVVTECFEDESHLDLFRIVGYRAGMTANQRRILHNRIRKEAA